MGSRDEMTSPWTHVITADLRVIVLSTPHWLIYLLDGIRRNVRTGLGKQRVIRDGSAKLRSGATRESRVLGTLCHAGRLRVDGRGWRLPPIHSESTMPVH